MHRYQSRLSIMLIAATIAALVILFFVPIPPKVSFGGPEMSFYSDNQGMLYPQVFVTVQNKGRFPIWYNGGDNDIREFVVQGDVSKGERHVHSSRSTQASWNCLSAGETVRVEIPTYELFDVAKLGFEFRDWKGRATHCWSEDFDFSSVPDEGVRGVAPKPPALIQK